MAPCTTKEAKIVAANPTIAKEAAKPDSDRGKQNQTVEAATKMANATSIRTHKHASGGAGNGGNGSERSNGGGGGEHVHLPKPERRARAAHSAHTNKAEEHSLSTDESG